MTEDTSQISITKGKRKDRHGFTLDLDNTRNPAQRPALSSGAGAAALVTIGLVTFPLVSLHTAHWF